MRIAAAQINATVGSLEDNANKIKEYIAKAKQQHADLIIFPELAITGYPPEDLLLKPKFINDNIEHIKDIAAQVNGISAVIGFVDKSSNELFNAAAIISDGKIREIYHKIHLPNYGVFDEKRYFSHGTKPIVYNFNDVLTGINICEDVWVDDSPVKTQSKNGAKLILVINASPYHCGKIKEREKIVQKHAKENGVYIVYVNLVGGQDELVFDGYSMAVSPDGKIIAQLPGFKEDLLIVDIPINQTGNKPLFLSQPKEKLQMEAEVYNALLLGLKDYIKKNGFKHVVIGLSGGIDSAIVAALAVDALGKENVHGVFMPTRYSSNESWEDAKQLADNLGIEIFNIPIDNLFGDYLKLFDPYFKGKKADITEENLQARIRGNIMMAFSNKFGWIVLTTGNKSEMSTGYATLYGDMAGGFAVIKDVPKTLVYKISNYRNLLSPVIPQRIIDKAPTAELRPDQKDSDSLPEYDILDVVLKQYIEDDKEAKEIIAAGFDKQTVYKIINLVDKSEYKRRQSPPGIKITPKAFGKDRRIPITNKFTEKQ